MWGWQRMQAGGEPSLCRCLLLLSLRTFKAPGKFLSDLKMIEFLVRLEVEMF
jgi:hypothetical protein